MDPGHRPPLQRNRAGEEPAKRRRMARNALHAHPRWRRATHQRTKTRQNAARLRRRPRQREADIYDLKGWQHTAWHPKESAISERFRLSRMELNWLVTRCIFGPRCMGSAIPYQGLDIRHHSLYEGLAIRGGGITNITLVIGG